MSSSLKRKSLDDKKNADLPKAPKMSFSIAPRKPGGNKPKMNFSISKPQSKQSDTKVVEKSSKVAAVFNPDEESDEEEMPMEAKIRMRNLGKDTPVPSGPNSFGKTKQGFSQDYKMYERKLMESIGDPDKNLNKDKTSIAGNKKQ